MTGRDLLLPACVSAVSIAQSVRHGARPTSHSLLRSTSDRSVEVLLPRDAPFGTDTVVDLLRTDPSLNLQARAGEGVQADLSIRGTTFEQSLVLVNGFRVNDPETGHLNLDIPVPLDAITRIDVLHGSGSTFYGSDAIGGAVNLLTGAAGPRLHPGRPFRRRQLRLTRKPSPRRLLHRPIRDQLTGSRDQSDGFIFDRNYSSNALASESWLKTKPGTTDILLAASDRPYGANNFYGNYPEWERTKGWLGSIQQQLGQRTAASFGYTRHTDLFVLILGQPAIYENNHVTTGYEGALRRADDLGRNTTLAYGLEESGDSIHSNSLGHTPLHARNQGAGYANLSLRSLRRFSLSLGAREEVLSGQGSSSHPLPRRLHPHQNPPPARLRRPRLPPAHLRRPLLLRPRHHRQSQPQARIQLELRRRCRLDARQRPPHPHRSRLPPQPDQRHRLHQAASADRRRQWQAVNVPTLDITGAEACARVRLTATQQLQLSYTAAHSGNLPPNYLSEYAFNYAAQNAIFGWTGELPATWLDPRAPRSTSSEDHPDRLPALGRARAQHRPHPPLPPLAQPLQHRLHRNRRRPHAGPHHHGRHGFGIRAHGEPLGRVHESQAPTAFGEEWTACATRRTPSAAHTRLTVSNRGALSGRRALYRASRVMPAALAISVIPRARAISPRAAASKAASFASRMSVK